MVDMLKVLPTGSKPKLKRSYGAKNLVKVPEGFERVEFIDFYDYIFNYGRVDFDYYACNSKGTCIKNPNVLGQFSLDGKEYSFHTNIEKLSYYVSGSHHKAVKELVEERTKEKKEREEEMHKKFMNTLSTTNKIYKWDYNKYIKGTKNDIGWTSDKEWEEGPYGQGGEYVDFYTRKVRGGSRRRSRGFTASLKKVFRMTRRVRHT